MIGYLISFLLGFLLACYWYNPKFRDWVKSKMKSNKKDEDIKKENK